MEKIRITRNIKRIEVNDNGDCIVLDFDDLNLPYRYYGMVKKLQNDRIEFHKRLDEIYKSGSATHEIVAEQVELERDMNIYFRDAIDEVFGKDTCKKVYGDILPSVEMHLAFFDALSPYFEEEAKRRRAKMDKYSAKRMGS